MMMISYCQN